MRLFFGIPLDPKARQAANDFLRTMQKSCPGRYTIADNLHMTVCFIGEVAPEDLSRVQRIGREASQYLPDSELQLAKPGFFGKKDSAILYLHAEGGNAYASMAQILRSKLSEQGLPYDPKPFVPHITLARKTDLRAMGSQNEFPSPSPVHWKPQGLVLFHSHRVNNILTYTPLQTWQSTGTR